MKAKPSGSLGQRYLKRSANYPLWRFVAEWLVWSVLARIPAAILLALLFGNDLHGNMQEVMDWFSLPMAILVAVIVAPVLETVIFQNIPLLLLRKMGMRGMWACTLSAALFASVHLYGFAVVVMVFFTGWVFAAAMWAHLNGTFWGGVRGIGRLSALHSVHNALTMTVYLCVN